MCHLPIDDGVVRSLGQAGRAHPQVEHHGCGRSSIASNAAEKVQWRSGPQSQPQAVATKSVLMRASKRVAQEVPDLPNQPGSFTQSSRQPYCGTDSSGTGQSKVVELHSGGLRGGGIKIKGAARGGLGLHSKMTAMRKDGRAGKPKGLSETLPTKHHTPTKRPNTGTPMLKLMMCIQNQPLQN